MKITVQDLLDKNACNKGIALFCRLSLQDVDFAEVKKVTIRDGDTAEYAEWMAREYRLSLTIECSEECSLFENGNEIRRKTSSGYWRKTKRDENGNEIWRETKRDESGNEIWREIKRDESGNEIRRKTSSGYWRKTKRDENGNEIKREDSTGYWREITRDESGNEIGREDSDGYWHKITRDESGAAVNFESSIEFTEDELFFRNRIYKGSNL